jgi:hypothetical protein
MDTTYVSIAIGGVAGAVGTVAFLLRSKAFSDDRPKVFPGKESSGRGGVTDRRRLSIRIVVSIYCVIAYGCFVATIAIGDSAIIALTGVIALLASAALWRLWEGR